MTNRAVILAGGEGIRFADGEVPKVLQYVDGMPVIAHTINCLKNQGFSDENINVLVRGKFADEVLGFLYHTYPHISPYSCERQYEWKDFGPMSKALELVKYAKSTWPDSDYDSPPEAEPWEDDILLVLNGDSIYPARSIEIATNVAKQAFGKYFGKGGTEKRYSALIYALKTPFVKKRRLPVFQMAMPANALVLGKDVRSHVSIDGNLTDFQQRESNLESAIFAYKAGDFLFACGQSEGHFVPAIEKVSTLDEVLWAIHPEKKDRWAGEYAERAVENLVNELNRSGANIKMPNFDTVEFDDLSYIKDNLVDELTQRMQKGYLPSEYGTGLSWICKEITKDRGLRSNVLCVHSNATYLNLNDMQSINTAREFLKLLDIPKVKYEDEDDDVAEAFGGAFFDELTPQDFKNLENCIKDKKELLLEAEFWGLPIDLRIFSDEFGDADYVKNRNWSLFELNQKLMEYLRKDYGKSAADILYKYITVARIEDWLKFAKPLIKDDLLDGSAKYKLSKNQTSLRILHKDQIGLEEFTRESDGQK
jgi:hypothetical protein